jgi:plasmid maintenance system antidote protein VapI
MLKGVSSGRRSSKNVLPDREGLAASYLAGSTVDSIAEEAGVHRVSVYDALHGSGVPLRGHLHYGDILTKQFLVERADCSLTEIAEEVGCSESTVREWKARRGLRQLDPALVDRLRRLRSARLTYQDMAAVLGVHPRTVSRWLVAAGLVQQPSQLQR